MKPTINFYCIGTQKAGTTSLHDILIQHPDIYLPTKKEAHFFHKDELFAKGKEWYLNSFFQPYENEKITGSITPDYMFWENTPKRIFDTCGSDIKFIVILRNPVDRAFSHYLMSVKRGYESLSFKEAINQEPDRLKKDFFSKNHFSYIERGLYNIQLERYLNFFKRENFFLINFEKELVQNREKTLRKIFKFLEIDHLDINLNKESNVAKMPKVRFLNKALYSTPKLVSALGKVIPLKLKKHIRENILHFNEKKIYNKSIDDKLKFELINEYFIEDLNLLQNKFNFNVSNWLNI